MGPAAGPHGGGRILDTIFDDVGKLQIPRGADQLDLKLDVDASDGVPAVHLALTLHGAGLPEAAQALVAPPPPEVVFGPRGHGTILFIAMHELELNRPDIKKKVDGILPADDSGRPDYFHAANWADYIKRSRPETKPWHFVDLPYDPESTGSVPALPGSPNAISQLAALRQGLGETDDPAEQLDPLRFIMHIVGDLHQPLHCITRITPDFPAPQGDRGGNDFKLRGPYHNLHSLWDDSVNLQLPDSAESLADEIVTRHPRASLAREIGLRDPEGWAREGFAIAVKRGYGPLEKAADDRPTPSNRYLRAACEIGQRQAALGGYRLADLLVDIFGG
jgi:hypothetical protein